MHGLDTKLATLKAPAELGATARPGVRVSRPRLTPRRHSGHALRCVSSGHLSDGRSCQKTVPAEEVLAAWARERAGGSETDGFFEFAWHGELWLGYGQTTGRVRGVYCPEHRAARKQRSATHPTTPRGGAPDVLVRA